MNNKATAEGSTEAVTVPETVCLVASRFFFAYDEKYGEFRKKIHSLNPRYAELKGVVDDPTGVQDGVRNPHGRILEAWDAYDTAFHPKGHTLVTVCGGYNGGGSGYRWCEYLGEISGAVRRLADRFGFAWLVDLHEHSDVWSATLGFNDRRGVPADGSDHETCAWDDFLAYDRYRDAAVAGKRPFGLVDWGHRSYDWAWAKLGGPYAFPRTAFHGSLINPTRTANRFAAFSADVDRFDRAYGVYESASCPAFYAVAEAGPSGLDPLEKGDLRAFGAAAPRFLLEDWRPRPRPQTDTAG